MTQGERVKAIRKKSNLTLEKFGKSLGVGKTAISKIENNERNLTDQMALSICREFNVRKEWLIDGTGEMFNSLTRNQVIMDFAADLIMEEDSFKKRLVEALSELDEDEWKILEKIAVKAAQNKS